MIAFKIESIEKKFVKIYEDLKHSTLITNKILKMKIGNLNRQ